MKSEKVCKICGAQMEQITFCGTTKHMEIKNSKNIEEPEKKFGVDTYLCGKCGNTEVM